MPIAACRGRAGNPWPAVLPKHVARARRTDVLRGEYCETLAYDVLRGAHGALVRRRRRRGRRRTQLVKSVTDEVLAAIRTTKDKAALRKLAEQKVLPHFDFRAMTQLAVGQHWRQASPEQQKSARGRVPDAAREHLHRVAQRRLDAARSRST